MATTDAELMAEIRSITDYDTGLITDGDLEDLVGVAKREVQSNKDDTSLDFYGDIRAERTLFWLACIFAKVKTGEIEGADFEISELRVESDGDNSMFFDNFWRNYHSIGDGRPRGHIKANRQDRTYNFDN